jgi:hypothetical protein
MNKTHSNGEWSLSFNLAINLWARSKIRKKNIFAKNIEWHENLKLTNYILFLVLLLCDLATRKS